MDKYDNSASQVIFEITSTIDHYKKQGYKIAIDDAGAGYSGLNLISSINPDYIKLDMKLIRDIDKKQS